MADNRAKARSARNQSSTHKDLREPDGAVKDGAAHTVFRHRDSQSLSDVFRPAALLPFSLHSLVSPVLCLSCALAARRGSALPVPS